MGVPVGQKGGEAQEVRLGAVLGTGGGPQTRGWSPPPPNTGAPPGLSVVRAAVTLPCVPREGPSLAACGVHPRGDTPAWNCWAPLQGTA